MIMTYLAFLKKFREYYIHFHAEAKATATPHHLCFAMTNFVSIAASLMPGNYSNVCDYERRFKSEVRAALMGWVTFEGYYRNVWAQDLTIAEVEPVVHELRRDWLDSMIKRVEAHGVNPAPVQWSPLPERPVSDYPWSVGEGVA